MTQITGARPPAPIQPRPQSQTERLRTAALQLEGIFVQRLFAAMRDTVPDDGLLTRSSGEDTFTQLLDEQFSQQVPKQWNGEHSLAQALYRQLAARLGSPDTDSRGPESR